MVTSRISPLVIGVDLGATKTAAALVDEQANILNLKRRSTPTESPKILVRNTIELIEEIFDVSKACMENILGIGLGVAGLMDFQRGVVIFSPNLPLRNLPLREIVHDHFNLPTFLDNDANVAAMGEKFFGAGRGVSNLVCLTIGTGIGGGIIIDDRIYRGAGGSAAEIGHMVIDPKGPPCGCGNRGCLEAFASGTAIARRAREAVDEESMIFKLIRGKIDDISAEIVARAAMRGDPLAKGILRDAGEALGVGLSNVINIFNPEMIIIGGGMAEIENLLTTARAEISRRALAPNLKTVKIVGAKLGTNAGVLGAAALVLYELGKLT
ncbi:MAG: ROK family protein [Actinomycetota bacterium]